jgi:hypothetical protein
MTRPSRDGGFGAKSCRWVLILFEPKMRGKPRILKPSHVETAAVGGRGQSGEAPKQAVKGRCVLVTNLGADIVYGMLAPLKKLFRLFNAKRLDIVHRTIAGRCTKAAREGSRRQTGAGDHTSDWMIIAVVLRNPGLTALNDAVSVLETLGHGGELQLAFVPRRGREVCPAFA